jgi:hypothetical protein
MGMDLSLTGAAAVVVPECWDVTLWGHLDSVVAGRPLPDDADPRDRVERVVHIAARMLAMARHHDVKHVYVEDYAFGAVSRAHAIGEGGGAVKAALYSSLGLVTIPVVGSRARKLMFGKLPREGVKGWVQARLGEAGAPPGWTEDEGDAFVVANYGLSELGRCCFCSER